MLLRALAALPLLLAALGAARTEQSGPRAVAPGPGPVQRRYSEATLASDHSRALERALQRSFVEWLLARREKKSHDVSEPLRREAEPPKPAGNGENLGLGTPGAQEFLGWLWEKQEKQSFPALEGSEGLREFLEQEFLPWLMSGELCRATSA